LNSLKKAKKRRLKNSINFVLFSICFTLIISLLGYSAKADDNKGQDHSGQSNLYTQTQQTQKNVAPSSLRERKGAASVKTNNVRTSEKRVISTGKAGTDTHSKTAAGHHNNAKDSKADSGEEKFDIGGMIFGHISDSHSFHLWGDLAIPLPCIFYDKQNGLSMFMSSKFDHGHTDVKGYHYDHGAVSRPDGLKFWDFSITKNVFAMLFVAGMLSLLFLSVARAYKRREGQAPKGVQSFIEPLFLFIRDDIAKENIGEKKFERYVPYLVSIFFFILGLNLLGLVPIFPGSANVTGNIAVTMVLAIITAIITNASGTKDYWQHLVNMPGVPGFVKIILTPIELLGAFIIKPASLMIRLFANITAGHIIILSLVSLIFMFSAVNGVAGKSFGGGLVGSALAVPFVLFMNGIELFVSFLQAYIFTMLSALYIGQAVEEHAHH